MIKQRSHWTPQEDALISTLHDQKGIQDWDEIARLVHEEYHMPAKSPKLYKERYTNFLNPSVPRIDWSHEEQILFMKLHNQIGNKWATIAQHLSGKTDNCVKNHFYSKLRKLLRKLNKIIQFFLKKQFRPIDISIMYKIVEAAEERFKDKPNCQPSVSLECLTVENQMLEFAMFKGDPEDQDSVNYTKAHIEEYKELISQIYRVSKLYKRKSKKVRNSLIQAPLNHSQKKNKKDTLKHEDSDHSEPSKKKNQKTKQKLPNNILVNKAMSSQSESSSVKNESQKDEPFDDLEEKRQTKKSIPQPNARIQVEEGDGIQQLLRTAGILHDEVQHKNGATNERNSRKYSSSQQSISSIAQNNQPQQSFLGKSSMQYSPLHSFTSQQMQSFLGFPMVNNNYANFTLSQKSSFKSYSQRDPSEIDNPFFDEYSSSNGRLMFPMNFSMPGVQQYQQQGYGGESADGYLGFEYVGEACEQAGEEENGKLNGKKSHQR